MHLWSEPLVPTLKYQTLTVISLHPLTSIIQMFLWLHCLFYYGKFLGIFMSKMYL